MGVSRFTDKTEANSICDHWRDLHPFFQKYVQSIRQRVKNLMTSGELHSEERAQNLQLSQFLQSTFMYQLSAMIEALDGRIFCLEGTSQEDEARFQEMQSSFASTRIDTSSLESFLGKKRYGVVSSQLPLMFPKNAVSDWGLYLYYRTCLVRTFLDIGSVTIANIEAYFKKWYPDFDINS